MSNINQKKRIYVSDIVSKDFEHWNNESVILDCGTGTGKTTFILKDLARYAYSNNKNMLYLCNRKKLREQIQHDVGYLEFSNMEVESYQQLQYQIENHEPVKHYDYVIADEAHYILCDSTFNIYTDLIYYFLTSLDDCVVIYMSATAKSLYKILESKGKVKRDKHFTIKTDYSYVDHIYFYDKKELFPILDNLLENTDDKILYFCNSKDKFKDVYNHYKGRDVANFICSEYTKDKFMSEINESDCIKYVNENYITFEKRLLIATKALDNGVDLKDLKIKHIVTDIFDLESAVQCLGRKRIIGDADTCNFYIRDYSKKSIWLFHQQIKKELDPVQKYKQQYDEFLKEYGKRSFHNSTIYVDWQNTQLPQVNEIRYLKLQLDDQRIKTMYKLTYRMMILNYLGSSAIDKVSKISFSDQCTKSNLNLFLESHINQKLFQNDRKPLISLCNLHDDHNRQLKSFQIIKSYFEECKLSYQLIKGRETTNGKKTYWLIKELDTNTEKSI